jgi:hypothetical protein
MSSDFERFRATPGFQDIGRRAGMDVFTIMDVGLVSFSRGEGIAPVVGEGGESQVLTSPDTRFQVKVQPMGDEELTDEAAVRAHLPKRYEWFDRTSRVDMTTRHNLLYWDSEIDGNNSTELVSTLTFEVPFGDGQTCRWVGMTWEFQDEDGQPDPRGREIFLRGFDEPQEYDEIVLNSAMGQAGASCHDLL